MNGCLAFILKRVQMTVCNAYGEQRYKSNGKTAKQVTYWELILWSAQLLGNPVIEKSIFVNTAAARQAADEETNVVRDDPHFQTFATTATEGCSTTAPLCCSTWGLKASNSSGQMGLKAGQPLKPHFV